MPDKFEDIHSAIVASVSLPDAAPLEDWMNTADMFAASPTVDNFAQLKMASRHFARFIRSAGIEVAPDRLARAADIEVASDRLSADPSSPEAAAIDRYIARRYPGRQ